MLLDLRIPVIHFPVKSLAFSVSKAGDSVTMEAFYIAIAVIVVLFLLIVAYLWHVNRAMDETPPEALRLCPKRWTPEELKEAYERYEKEPTDVGKYLPQRTGRRYIVVGGSGECGFPLFS